MIKAASRLRDINERCVIAIDGTSASGKGTIAQLLAQRFALIHFQSSVVYRYLALQVLSRGISNKNENEIISISESLSSEDIIDSKELYSEDITAISSIVAAIPDVRTNLYHFQRNILLQHPRVVMDGRDIGTVIAPDADIKIFISAALEVRAERRYQQLLHNEKNVTFDDILQALATRDERDQHRATSPLAIAQDAIVIDTTTMTIDDVFHNILEKVDGL